MSAPTISAPVGQPVGPLSPPPAPTRDHGNKPINIGPTFLAATAILAGSSALGTPISGRSWVLPLVEVVAVIWLVGVGGRLIRLPTAITALLQLAGFLIALTSLFTSSGIGGVLPNGAVIAEAGTLLSGAWQQIVSSSPPAASTPELAFLISLAIGCAAFIADFLVAEARSPALVALPLLCLYSVPASIATTMLPWYSFAVPAVLYAVLLAVTGHRDRRTGVRAGVGLAINGGAITILATVVALLVAGSATGIGTTGRLPRTSGGGAGAIGLSPFASLQGSLRSSAPVDVLTASGMTGPDYFRAYALTVWTPNKGWSLGALEADVPDVNGPLSGVPLATDSRVTVTTLGYQDRFLPILTGTSSVTGLAAGWNFDSALDTVYRADKVKAGRYVLAVDQTKPTAAALEADSVVSGGSLTETGSLAQSVRDTAQQVTGSAEGAFDKARALEQWFTNPANGFVYSLNVPVGNSGDALVDFLTNKQGYCEQYAAAMAIMLRSLNIPTRVVIGFTQGVKQANGSYLISSHDAHAWVEVNFEDHGWVRFDPTPPVGGQGGQQGFQDSAGATTSTPATTTAPPISGAGNLPDGGTTTKVTRSSAVSTQVDVAAGTNGSSSKWLQVVLILLAAVAVLAGLLMVPTGLRAGRRRRRLARARSGGAGAASAAWAEIEDTAIDHGIVAHTAESARVTANRLARRAHLGPADRIRLRAVVMGAEREWYGAPASADGADPIRAGSPADGAGSPADGAGSPADRRATGSAGTTGSAGITGSPGITGSAGTTGGAGTTGRAGTMGGAGTAASATTTLERDTVISLDGADLAMGVTSVAGGLREHAPVRLVDRIVPRSLRRGGR